MLEAKVYQKRAGVLSKKWWGDPSLLVAIVIAAIVQLGQNIGWPGFIFTAIIFWLITHLSAW